MFHSRDATDAKHIFRIDDTLIYDVLLHDRDFWAFRRIFARLL
jgi:hypothetical protein